MRITTEAPSWYRAIYQGKTYYDSNRRLVIERAAAGRFRRQ